MRLNARKVGLGLVALLMFVLAIELLKAGAKEGVGPFLRGALRVDGGPNALSMGWLMAYLALSGSPVAAVSLTLLAAGSLDEVEAFFMINGSRLGASMVVLLIGFFYHLRGHKRTTSLGMGVLSLLVTAAIYGPSMFIGYALLDSGALDAVRFGTPRALEGAVGLLYGGLVGWARAALPFWAVFLAGAVAMVASLQLFDRALPAITAEDLQVRDIADLVYKPWVMFLVGFAVTALTLSVSVSLSILVPLSVKGIVRRENVIPYIMGANVSTFVDTLFAALLVDHPRAFTVVLVEMLSVAAVSAVVLAARYELFESFMLRTQRAILATNRNLLAFMALMFAVPLALAVL